MMHLDPRVRREHDDFRRMALALEGVAGAIHVGRPVSDADLATAARCVREVWDCAPPPTPAFAADGEAELARLQANARGCAHGDPRAAGLVSQAALRLASQLRIRAQDLAAQPPKAPLLAATTKAIAALEARHGRYGRRPTAAA